MEAPGLSLFAGAALQLDTSQHRPEEDEAFQDHQLRQRELQHELENGFDDFIHDDDDEDDSVNNSSKFHSRHLSQSRLHSNKDCMTESLHRNHYNDNNDVDGKLQMLYDVRVQEVKRLTEELESCRREAVVTHDALYGRLAVANAEKDRAHISLQQSQELVASSEHCIAKLEHKVSVLSNKVETLQEQNNELNSELTATSASLVDVQKRLQFTKSNTRQTTDEMFNAQQERYKEDTQKLENDLSRTRNKLIEKENELLILEKRFIDAERMKEDLLVDKGSTINKLVMELEEAQNRLANNDIHEWKDRLSHLTRERNTARFQVKEMAGKLEATATELVEMRSKYSKLQEEMLELESTLEELTNGLESDSFTQLKGAKFGKKFLSHSDKIVVLRNELTKSIAMQKIEREQINKLTKALQRREDLIKNLKKTEENCKSDIEAYKEKEAKYISNIGRLQKQLELRESIARNSSYTRKDDSMKLDDEFKTKTSPTHSIKSKMNSIENSIDKSSDVILLNENNKLIYQLKDAQKQMDELRNSYIEVCGDKDKLMRELDDLKSCDVYKCLEEERANVEELLNQLKKEKLKVDDLGNKLLNQQLEDFQKQLNSLRKEKDESKEYSIGNEELEKIIDQLKDENNKLRDVCEDQNTQISMISMELKEAKLLITQLNSEIELQGQRDVLITELKDKAKQFEQYIMDQMSNKKNASTSPRSFNEYDPDGSKENCIIKQAEKSTVEKKIRQDLAQHFALEVKNIEEEHNRKLAEVESIFNMNVIQLTDVIKAKTKEVETLQDVILSERVTFQELLPKSNPAIDESMIHEKCKNKINQYEEIIQRLQAEIDVIKSKGESDSALIDLNQKLLHTVDELEKLRKKYKTTKRNVSKYEEYIKNKNKEMRIQYETSLSKMQERLNVHINQVGEQLKSRTKVDTNK